MIWRVISYCLMWCLWREHNARIFEGCERSVVDLKLQLYGSLFDWLAATGLFSFSKMLEYVYIFLTDQKKYA